MNKVCSSPPSPMRFDEYSMFYSSNLLGKGGLEHTLFIKSPGKRRDKAFFICQISCGKEG